MRFIVAQIGARHGYAVPSILHKAGLLERFYTDLTADVGLGRWLVKCGPLLGLKTAAKKLASRRVPEPIRAKTTTFAWPTLWFTCQRSLAENDPVTRFRQQLRWNRALGQAMIRRGYGNATHLYSMLGECYPLLARAKERGLTTVTEIYILLSAERILKREHSRFPEWEAAPPDFEAVRREYLGQDGLVTISDFAVCPSEAVRQDAVQSFGFAAERTAVVPYGVEPHWLSLRPRPITGRVLFVGTAGLRKGIQYLAMAAEQLHGRGRDYRFYVAGNVSRHIATQPACRWLNFLDRIPRDQVGEEYAKADVFVLPSLAEGSAEATYEALACGVPVITTEAAGAVVRDGIEGRLVAERDVGALANAIDDIVENRALREQMSKAARRRILDYDIEQYRQRLVAALQSFGS